MSEEPQSQRLGLMVFQLFERLFVVSRKNLFADDVAACVHFRTRLASPPPVTLVCILLPSIIE